MVARALQAVGACTGMALGRAIVRDVFSHGGTALAGAGITAAVLLRIPETRQAPAGGDPKPPLLAGLSRLLRERRYLGYTLVVGGTSSMFYAFLTAAPLILITRLGVTPDAFGRYLVLGTCGTVVSSCGRGTRWVTWASTI